MFILQTPNPEELAGKLSADSLRTQTEQVVQNITSTPASELVQDLAHQAIQFGLKVVAALLIYAIGAWLIKLVRRAVRKGFERKGSEKTLSTFVDSLVSIGLWVLLIIITISTLGINTTSLAAVLAAGGMAIGMALSGTVQNFAGGLMLLIFKPFKVGDFIDAQGFSGTVTEVNIVSTKILTVDNRIIILPNGALSNGNINNISALPLRRVDQTVTVAYGNDAEKVREVIESIAKADSRILDATTEGAADPFVAISSLNESTISFTVRVWVNKADYWGVWFYLNEAIYKELPLNGVRFAFPQMDVHLKQD